MHDLGMEQQRVELPLGIGHGGHRRIRARGDHRKTRGESGDEIAVARPDPDL